MGNNKKPITKSRRDFFSIFKATDQVVPVEMIKMLTAEGKLVEVSKAAVEAASKKQKTSKKEIFNWMINPSKANNE
jgi:hypothetical protein